MAQTEADANAVAYDFRGFQFPSFSFERKRFLKKAYFHQATFQDVDFSSAVFCQEVRFVSSNFKGEVVFAGAQFLADVNFAGAHFGHEADFRLANFHELTLFSWATFSETADFHWATFNKEAIFEVVTVLKELRVIGHADQRCFEGACNFRFLRLSKDAAVTLERVNLEHATFLDTDLERFSLRDVNWHRTPSRLGRLMPRQSLSDEFNFPKEVNMTEADYEKVAENYRQLVLNYERKRDYDTAEDFHIGEMEMRRKKRGAHIQNKGLRKLREWTNSYGFYRALSNYGTSYVQAFLVLLAFLCIFSVAFLYSGFRTTAEEPQRTIEYNLLDDGLHHYVGLREWTQDYFSAMSLSASIVTFQKDRFYEPLPGISRFWLFLSVIAFTGQGAMALLALRRRFRR